MKDLIEALQIFAKYIPDVRNPTSCSHDTLYVGCDPELVSDVEMKRLEELGFIKDQEFGDGFISFRYGSC